GAARWGRRLRRRVGSLPGAVFLPHVDRAWRRALAVAGGAIEAQRKLEEGGAVGLAARLLVGVGAHEKADQGDVGVDAVVGEFGQPLGDGVVIGVDPGVRRLGADELEAEGSQTAATGALEGVER